MKDEPSRKSRRTSGQKVLMFVIIVMALVFGFVLMAANSGRLVAESQVGEKERKPLISDSTLLQNDLLAAAEALKYRPNEEKAQSVIEPREPQNRIVVIQKGETSVRKRERALPLLTDEEREAARKYRDLRASALASKSSVETFRDMDRGKIAGRQENSQLQALLGQDRGNTSAAELQAALMQGTRNAEDINAYQHKLDFLTRDGGDRTPQGYTAEIRKAPLAPMELKAGSVIPGLLLTGINSDLPGTIVGQVSENVWDTATGRFLLIPQGTRILGVYDSKITQGQKRVSVVWNRLVYPDGSSLNISGSPGADLGGYSGIKGKIDSHYGQLLTAVLFTSAFTALADIAADDSSGNNDKKSAKDVLLETTGATIANVGARLAERALEIQPTIVVKPGSRFNVMVQQDVVFLQPWKYQ
jgi:type IV secretion system protein VirB10